MAHIIDFPSHSDFHGSGAPNSRVPQEFADQLDAIRSMDVLDGVTYSEIPASKAQGDVGLGVSVSIDEAEGFAGWLMIHYSVHSVEAWDSQWRCTGYFRQSQIDEGEDPLITQMYWDYAYDVITPLASGSVNGAVSLSKNEFFDSGSSVQLSSPVSSVELRASWSPVGNAGTGEGIDAPAQINAWAELMMRSAGGHIIVRKRKASLSE